MTRDPASTPTHPSLWELISNHVFGIDGVDAERVDLHSDDRSEEEQEATKVLAARRTKRDAKEEVPVKHPTLVFRSSLTLTFTMTFPGLSREGEATAWGVGWDPRDTPLGALALKTQALMVAG